MGGEGAKAANRKAAEEATELAKAEKREAAEDTVRLQTFAVERASPPAAPDSRNLRPSCSSAAFTVDSGALGTILSCFAFLCCHIYFDLFLYV